MVRHGVDNAVASGSLTAGFAPGGHMLLVSAFAVLATFGAQAASAADTPIDLFCQGQGDRYVGGLERERARTAIRLRVSGGKGEALLPDALLADDDVRGWHEIKNLAVSPAKVGGKISFNWLFSPVMSLDRQSGLLVVSGSLANFTGTCTRWDARTSRMPGPGVAKAVGRAAAPAAGGIKTDWATPNRSAAVQPRKARAPGDFVLAKFKGGANWYPAQVLRIAGNLVTVQYATGIQESLPTALVGDLTWKVGSYIECKATSTVYVPVTVTAVRPSYGLDVVGNDGKPRQISMRSCRTIARS